MKARVGWHEYFMNIARQAATRSTCDRKHVGAVIVRDRTILSTGYNGSIRGMPHCDEVGHDMESGHCVGTIHAEANAIIQAAKNGVRLDDSEIYTTASPCWGCFKLIANSGIRRRNSRRALGNNTGRPADNTPGPGSSTRNNTPAHSTSNSRRDRNHHTRRIRRLPKRTIAPARASSTGRPRSAPPPNHRQF